MDIVLANIDHVEYISNTLTSYFKETNEKYGFQKYKDDYELMHKHVSKRIVDEEGDFVYLVALERSDPKGFINLFFDENGQGSILLLSGDTYETKKELVLSALGMFKERGLRRVHGEVMAFDTDAVKIYEELGMKTLMVSFNIKI